MFFLPLLIGRDILMPVAMKCETCILWAQHTILGADQTILFNPLLCSMHNAYYEHHHKKVSSLFLKMSTIALQTTWVACIVIIFLLIYTLIWWPPSLNIYYIIYTLSWLFNYQLFGPFQLLAWIDHRHFCSSVQPLLLLILCAPNENFGAGYFQSIFSKHKYQFSKKDPTFAFDILEFVILTFAQFFSPISENTSPSLRFLVLHFQQSHNSYCRQK